MSRQVVATFDREDRLLAAVNAARERKFPVADVHTPYPVHGIDEAMGIRPTRLGIFCFVAGLAGAAIAMGFQYWTHSVDWRVNVGGRPFNAWPAYVPVTFEVMVLMAGIGTVLAFFAVSRLYPGRRAVLPGPGATDDRFLVVVEGRDGAVDVPAVVGFFRAHGAVDVADVEPAPPGRRANGAGLLLLPLTAALVAVVVFGWTVVVDTSRPNDAILTGMMEPVAYPGDAPHPDLPGGTVAQPPQEGTIARGRRPLHFGATPAEAERAGRELRSPYESNDGVALARGGRVYANYCMVCHGPEGRGDGPVTKRGVPPPPSLLEGRAVGMAPGQIFHIVTYGQGNMPSHASQIVPEDRWAAALHVLKLQRR